MYRKICNAPRPVNGEKASVYLANSRFGLNTVQAGVVMAVPTQDQRDFDFLKKTILSLKVVYSA
jgi:leucyl-tRNA synthetase